MKKSNSQKYYGSKRAYQEWSMCAFSGVQEKLKEFEKLLSAERAKRLEERRQKWLQEREEARQRARHEQLKKGQLAYSF